MAPSVFISSRDGDLSHVRRTLDVGGDVNAREPRTESTCLHFAARGNHPDIVDLLLRRGANANLSNREGSRPLHEAASQGADECVRLLLDGGASLESVDKTRQNALHQASFYGRDLALKVSLEFLIKKQREERSIKHVGQEGMTSDGSSGLVIDRKDILGMTPLFYAAKNGHLECVRLLLDHGADPRIVNNTGSTCFHAAASGSCFPIVELLHQRCGSEPFKNLKDRKGRTPQSICKDDRMDPLLEGLPYKSVLPEEVTEEDPVLPSDPSSESALATTEARVEMPSKEGRDGNGETRAVASERFARWEPVSLHRLIETLCLD